MLISNKNATHIALKWATLLFIFGSLFIYISDILLDQYLDDFSFYTTYQTYKGIGFCGLVALILFFTIRHFLLRISKEENDLERERRFSERIQNSIPGIFFVLDEKGQLIKWNENTKKVSGLSDNELNKLYAIKRVEEENQQKAQQALNKVLRKGDVQADLWLKTKHDEKKLFKVTANSFKNDGDYYVVGTGIDISGQVKANKQIKRQNYQLKAAQEIAQLGYWENNLIVDKLVWSDIVYDLFGLNKEDYTPTIDNFLDLVHPDDRDVLQQNIEKLKKHNFFETQYRLIKPDGEIGWFREIGEVYEWENNEPKILHGIVLDITEQKNQEKKIKESHIRGENKERKRISNELHDGIAQYLSAALLHLDNTEDHLDIAGGPTPLHNARALVKRAVTETRTISQNLMPQAIEKHGLVVAIKSLIKQYQLSTDIKFAFNINIEDSFSCDNEIETNLYRIIQELLSNAVRHSKCNQVLIQISEQNKQLICIVKDDGKGAKTDDITDTDGLGLQSIRNRVELLSGTIEFNNKPNQGLDINIIIPLK